MHYDYTATDDDDETFELHSLKRLTRTGRPYHRHHHYNYHRPLRPQKRFADSILYVCRCTSYYYILLYSRYNRTVKNTLSLFVCFFANPLWSSGVYSTILISPRAMTECITYSYTKTCNVCTIVLHSSCIH